MSTPDLTGKTRAEVALLLSNAESVLGNPKRVSLHARASALVTAARDQLLRMPATAARRVASAETVADAARGQLAAAAVALHAAFDLSAPAGTRAPHRLAGADGGPKTGGRQRNGAARRNPYISFKRGERVVSLGFLLGKEEDAATGGHWYVSDREGAAAGSEVQHAQDFAAAQDAFRALLAELAPAK